MNKPSKKNGSKAIRIVSFGYKYASPPQDAALVIDCRGFINPHYDAKLRPKTGASRAVADYLSADPEVKLMLGSIYEVLGALLPGLVIRSNYHTKEVKLAFGCTGGKHRSRFFAIKAGVFVRQLIAQNPQWGCRVVINHRDQGRE